MTDEELKELIKLSEEVKIDKLHRGLTVFDEKTNPNYKFLFKAITEQEYEVEWDGKGTGIYRIINGFKGCILEGSSRSGKTYAGVDIIIWLCTQVEKSCSIVVVRETYNELKTTLFPDFKKRLDDFGLDNPFHHSKEMQSFKIGKNQISLVGADKIGKFHGAGSDYVFFNEMLHVDKGVFDQLEMRCRKFWWGDYNPSVTEHYVFESVIPRYDIGFLRTTFRDNPYLSISERNKILSYEPYLPNSYEVKDNQLWYQGRLVDDNWKPPEHPLNVKQGTASEFDWLVYGLGLRGAMEGVIFKNVVYIDKFPDLAHTYGCDFGFVTDPSTLVKYAEDELNIYLELLLYKPTETPEDLNMAFEAIGVERHLPITADSSDKFTGQGKDTVEMVRGLRDLGWEIHKVSKKKGIMFGINTMRRKKIHIVKNHLVHHARKEQENYRFKEVHGILINQPRDLHNHFWDGSRYAMLGQSSNYDIYY